MTLVLFGLPGDFDQDLSRSLPVKVLDQEMALVAQTSASKGAELKPGNYIVQSVLPNGQPVHANFRVDLNEAASGAPVMLRRRTMPPSPETRPVVSKGPTSSRQFQILSALNANLAGGIPASSDSMQDFTSAIPAGRVPDAKLQLVAGNPLSPSAKVVPLDLSAGSASASIIPGEARILRFIRPNCEVWNIHLPVSPTEGLRLEFRGGSEDWFPHIRLADPDAELLLQYLGSQQADEFAQLVEQSQSLAEVELAEKFERPMLAALGGYLLLKTGALDRLQKWPSRLSVSWPLLPDCHILAGEHLARLGRHEEALDLFIRAADLGAPVFRAGLRHSLDRLSSYQADIQQDKLPATSDAALTSALRCLGRIAMFVDFNRPILTYTTQLDGSFGRDPIDEATFEAFDAQPIRLAV